MAAVGGASGGGTIPGYHCWAEFYAAGRGWLPVDASEAWKHPGHAGEYFGRQAPNRVLISVGRDIELVPPQDGAPVNILFSPYVEVDGRPFPHVSTAISLHGISRAHNYGGCDMRMRWTRRMWVGVGMGAACCALALSALAAEHGGHEHGGQEHGGTAVSAEPSAQDIRDRIAAYVKEKVKVEGAFRIKDEVTGSTRTLTLDRVHDRVGKTGGAYYSCTDMRDAATGQLLDLDFDVKASDGKLDVVDVRIHKVDGKPHYTYDEHDQRIPIQ